MVKGAHRKMMRQLVPNLTPDKIEEDFQRRVHPSFRYCVQTGNAYSASVYLALCGLINGVSLMEPKRVGLFSYGSGCSSEFYSGIITPKSKEKLNRMQMDQAISSRYTLNMEEYDHLVDLCSQIHFGMRESTIDISTYRNIYDKQFLGKKLLVFKGANNYHRKYDWS